MDAILHSLYSGFPVLLMHFTVTVVILIAAIFIYTKITPHNELQLIKEGNMAAAISLSGAILGLAIPLASCMAHSINVYDIVIWGVAILLLQLGTYFMVNILLRDLTDRIVKQELAPVLLLAVIKVAIGTISAAAVTG